MRVSEVGKALNLRCMSRPQDDPEVTGGYVGDLLSWVMSRAGAGSAWITIMSNKRSSRGVFGRSFYGDPGRGR